MRHQHISFIKSATRIFGYIYLVIDLPSAAFILVASEIFGVVEEIGHE